jgi:hypothetical protein
LKRQISSPEKSTSTLSRVVGDSQDGGDIKSGSERSLELYCRHTGISIDRGAGGSIKLGLERSLDDCRTTSL